MAFKRSGSRDAARRVAVGFHRRARPLPCTMWTLAAGASLMALGWAGLSMLRGEQRPFEGGPVSQSHRHFENDCAACHLTWAPLQRVLVLSPDISSISDEKCMKCHAAPAHHADRTRVSAKAELSCAACHHEHQGDQDLRKISDQHCLECHEDLKSASAGRAGFCSRITGFREGDHPPFKLHELLEQKGPAQPVRGARDPHHAYDVLAFIGRDSRDLPDPNAKIRCWQDGAAIRFNHSKHLKVLIQKDGRRLDWSKNCQACHEPTHDGRLMQPISYMKHCADCHPLYFDASQKERVPHDKPEIVHGWLTDYYMMRLAESREGNVDPSIAAPRSLPLPGRPPLDERAKTLSQKIAESEDNAIWHAVREFNRPGGCRYCHSFQDAKRNSRIPEITPTRIPLQWLGNSRFDHHAHRMLECTSCHAAVPKSEDTGDVSIPKIETCFRCHALEQSGGPGDKVASHFASAGNHCVDCHTYHDKKNRTFTGALSIESFNQSTAANKGRR
jgi:class III cytochrome C family protein